MSESHRPRLPRCQFPVLFVAVAALLTAAGCVVPPPKPEGDVEKSAGYSNYSRNRERLESESFDDTLCVIAFPDGRAPGNMDCTIMRLARPDYHEGGSGGGYTFQGIPLGGGSWNANVALAKDPCTFLVRTRLDQTHTPYLFYARYAGEVVDLGKGQSVKVLDIVPMFASASSADSLDFNRGTIPRHLAGVHAPAVFVVESPQSLDKTHAKVPLALESHVDWHLTEVAYARTLEREYNDDPKGAAESARLAGWVKSMRLIVEATSYIDGKTTNSFLALDHKDVVQEHRDRHAIEILNSAADADQHWDKPRLLLYDANRAVGQFDEAQRVVAAARADHALSSAQEATLNDSLRNATFHASREFRTRQIPPPQTNGRPFRLGVGNEIGFTDTGLWSLSLILSINPTNTLSVDGAWLPLTLSDDFSPTSGNSDVTSSDRYTVDMRYLSPLRIQLGRWGFRAHTMLGGAHYTRFQEASDVHELTPEAYVYEVSGWAGRVAVGITANDSVEGRNSRYFRTEFGYQYGETRDITINGTISQLDPAGVFFNFAVLF